MRQTCWLQLSRGFKEVATPTLSVLAAQQQQQQTEPHAAAMSASSSGQQPTHSSRNGPATESPDTADVDPEAWQPLQQLQKLSTYGAIIGVLLADVLSLEQKAVLIAASYPW